MSVEDRLKKVETTVAALIQLNKSLAESQVNLLDVILQNFKLVPGIGSQDKPLPARSIVAHLEANLPTDLRALVDITPEKDSVIVKPKKYLGAENFKKIHDVIAPLKGEWLPDGKAGSWKIPREVD